MKPTNELTAIYNMYHKDILGYITFKTGNNDIAEEIANDTFIKFNKYEYDESKANMRTWLRKLANGIISDYYRVDKAKYTTNISDFQDDNGNDVFVVVETASTDSLVQNSELNAKVEAIISTLNKLQQQIAELFLVKDMAQTEIAEILNIPINSVKGNITRIREAMAVHFQAEKAEYGIK